VLWGGLLVEMVGQSGTGVALEWYSQCHLIHTHRFGVGTGDKRILLWPETCYPNNLCSRLFFLLSMIPVFGNNS